MSLRALRNSTAAKVKRITYGRATGIGVSGLVGVYIPSEGSKFAGKGKFVVNSTAEVTEDVFDCCVILVRRIASESANN